MVKIKSIIAAVFLYIAAIAALTSCGSSVSPPGNAEGQEPSLWLNAYESVLENKIADGIDPSCCFALIYLDDDDVPELVIQPASYHMAQAELYAFDGSKVIEPGSFGSWGQLDYVPREGVINSSFTGQGITNVTVSEFKDGIVTELYSYAIEMLPDGQSVQYYYNGKKVTETEYLAESSKFAAGEPVTAPDPGGSDTYPLTKDGLERFLSEF